jgi:hypothetical protein
MTEIPIYANILKPIDELGSEIFFGLTETELQDFILSLNDKVGTADFTIRIIKQLNNSLVEYYEKYTENFEDENLKNEYEILKEVQIKLEPIR